jgi:Tol biopolymer transport system component/DNA-binding winged helix-turn-helix (wHTH) protein
VAVRYSFDDFVLDLDAYRLERNGVAVALEPKAFNLLALMVERPGHLFTKQEIFAAVWPDAIVTDHALTRVVAQLRRALGDEAREATYIETVPTRGYRWVKPARLDLSAVARSVPRRAKVDTDRTTIEKSARIDLVGKRFASIAVALAVAVVTLIALVWAQREIATSAAMSGDPRAEGVRWPVQLTTHDGLDLHPALSPRGDAIAFASDRAGAFEIFVRGFDRDGIEAQLTSDQGYNVQPAWSPDGRFIAYHSSRNGGVWVVPARGGVPKQVASTGSHPAWSPDGSQIAYQSDEHMDVNPSAFGAQSGSTIWTINADGSNPREITRAGQPIGGHAAPAWTPDGQRIAFSVFEGGTNNGVWLVPLDAQPPVVLAERSGLYEITFAPDASALYVTGGEAWIMRIPFDAERGQARGPQELIPVAGVPSVRGISVAADGSRIAFAGLALSSQIWSQPITRDGTSNGVAVALTRDTSRRNSLPVISPDGSKVAYMSMRRGEPPNIWMMNIDGKSGQQVTSNETAESLPQWFPDGRKIAYSSTRNGSTGLWAVDIATRREEPLFDLGRAKHDMPNAPGVSGRIAELELSPSMTRAALSLIVAPAGRRVLHLVARESGARPVTDPSLSVGYPSWSQDERSIAVEVKEGPSTHAAVFDVESGALRPLTNERGQTWIRGWSPDGRKVAAAALREGAWRLQWIDVESRATGTMMPPQPARVYVRYPEWSPRGDVVVFERGELRGNLWLLALR